MESEKTVGTILREARLAKGLSLEDLEKLIKVRASYLEALENDAYDKLPSAVFVKGMIRNYGNAVGCDGLELVKMFKSSSVGKQKATSDSKGIREVENVSLHIQLKEKRDIGSGTGKMELPSFINPKQIGVGLGLCAVLAVGFFAGPSIYDAVTSISMPSFATSTPAVEEKNTAPVVKPILDKVVLELDATGKCWLEVSADGQSIFEGMLEAQDKKQFEAKDKLIVKYGSIGVVKVSVNGENVDYGGEQGVAVKTYLRNEAATPAKVEDTKEDNK